MKRGDDLKQRTKNYALEVIKLVRNLPKTTEGKIVGGQILRSGTSCAANYRAVCMARSNAEFISRLGVVIEETDESAFWLEIIIESNIMEKNLVELLLKETNEILAIMITSSNSARKNQKK